MAYDTRILNNDVGVWWLSNNRTKMLDWVGGTNESYTMNELYSAMQTLQDEPATNDDGTCFNADTPVEYTIGKIDSGDNDPFYITFALMQRIKGGSLRSNGWAHVNGTNTGIVICKGTNVNMDSTDIGDDVTGGVDGAGTLLEIIDDGTDRYLVIRPDDATTAKEFLGTAGAQTITSSPGAHTFTQSVAQTSGNMIWANLYSIGTIDPRVHLYVYQGARATVDASTRVYSVNSATLDYWGNGHFDICVPIKEYDSATWAIIDGGYLRVFARKGGDLFASFEAANSITSGGRNPVPLQTSLDLDAGYSGDLLRGHGTKKVSFVGAVTGTFQNGEVISGVGGGRGILDLTNSTVTSGGELVYWPIATAAIGGALTAIGSSEVVTGATSTAWVTTNGAPAADGPAAAAWFTSASAPIINIGALSVDIDNNGTGEYYGVDIDCNANPLTEVYQWLKYVCQYTQGETDPVEQAFEDDLAQINIYGEEYEGGTTYVTYTGGTTPDNIAEGEAVTQLTTLATGIVMSHNTADDIVLIRSTRGEFETGYTIEADDDSSTWTGVTAENFAAKTAAPFGTFAGGTMFFARGVVPTDYLAADENSFICTDIPGAARKRPTSVLITVTNLWGNAITLDDADLVTIYPLTGAAGDIDKDPTDAVYAMNCDGGEAIGDTTLAVDAIPVWAPAAGRVVLIDDSDAGQEYVLRYSSWVAATDTYTLANVDIAVLTGGSTTTLAEAGVFGTTKRGDLVYNHDLDEVAYVTKVTDSGNLTFFPAMSGDPTGDHVEINCVPVVTTSSDNAFNCVMHEYPLTSSEQISIIYPESEFFFRTKVRNTREDDLVNGPIKPYSSDGSTTGSAQSIPTVRTIDTVIS